LLISVQDTGVAGMVRTGLWCERVLGTKVLSIGRPALAREDCVMELSGRSLSVRVALRGGWIWVSACSMDEADQPELPFNIGDGPEGWTTVRRFVAALERSGLKSLKERPIRIGAETGPDSFISS
jgi:hypothetical protein